MAASSPGIPIPQSLLSDINRLSHPSSVPQKKSKPILPSLPKSKAPAFFLPASEPPSPNPTKHIPELEKRARELDIETGAQRWGINVDALPPELREEGNNYKAGMI